MTSYSVSKLGIEPRENVEKSGFISSQQIVMIDKATMK